MSTVAQEIAQQFRELLPQHRPPRVGAEELSIFTRQLSAMIDAGINLPRALDFYSEGENDGDLRKVIGDVANKVISGVRFSHAMRSYPRIFSEVFISLIETGERSGQLSKILQRLADLMEKQLKMRKRVVATLTYPVMLLAVSMLCMGVFIMFILPMMEPMFKGMNIPLPLPTRILLATRLIVGPAVLVLALLGVGYWACRPAIKRYLESHGSLREQLAHWPLKLPVVGNLLRKMATARILYSLATMLDAGMTLVEAISRSSWVAGNYWVFLRMGLVRRLIIDGETVGHAMDVSQVFPQTAVQLVTVGEETSSITVMVKYVADMYDEEVDLALTDMANMMEPVLMGGMGLIVGFIVISAMLPTLQLINNL